MQSANCYYLLLLHSCTVRTLLSIAQASLLITTFPLKQVSVPSLPQDYKARVCTGYKNSNNGGFVSVSIQIFVKLTTCSSLACHAELCEAPDFSTVRKVDSSKAICAFDDKR